MYLNNSLLRALFGCVHRKTTTATRRAQQYFLRLAVQLGTISGSGSLSGLRIGRLDAALVVIFASGGMLAMSAQIQGNVDFANLIRTRASLQRTLEHCDGDPEFETALANWLEIAEPSLPADRQAVRETSLRLLEDTSDRQLVLALGDGLLRHALEDMKRDPTLVAKELAHALYADIGKAVKQQTSKAKAIAVPAYELGEDGTVTDERQARFLEAFLNLAAPRVVHLVRPSQRRLGDSTHDRPEQSDRGPVPRR